MITRLEAYRYRCFQKLALDVGSYQVLVGKNGAGKSTLLDLPILLGEILKTRDLSEAFFRPTASHHRPRADSPMELIYNQQDNWFSLAIEALMPNLIRNQIHRTRIEQANKKVRNAIESKPGRIYDSLRYELSFRVIEGALEISQENLFLLPMDRSLLGPERNGLWGEFVEEDELDSLRILIQRDSSNVTQIKGENRSKDGKDESVLRVPSSTPALASMPMDMTLFSGSQWFVDFLSNKAFLYAPDLEKLRNASLPPGRGWTVARDASTLPWSIFELKKEPDLFSEWLEHVRGVLPLLTDIEPLKRENDGLAYFRAHYGKDRVVSNSGLSDGTLTILALTILPFLRNVPPLLTIEEPENGIHPKAIEAVLEALMPMENTQIWVTTHSPIAVAATPLENLICLEQTRGEGVTVTRGTEHPRLKHWLGTPSLATLQSSGVL